MIEVLLALHFGKDMFGRLCWDHIGTLQYLCLWYICLDCIEDCSLAM